MAGTTTYYPLIGGVCSWRLDCTIIFNLFISFLLQGIDWRQFSDGITMVLFQGDTDYAKDHGVVKMDKEVLIMPILTVIRLFFFFWFYETPTP